MPDYLNIAGRVRTTAADGVVAEAQEVKDLLKNKSQQELNNDFSTAIEAILLLIPSAASSLNQLADKAFVNSSIATASATFRGTYNLVSDLNLTVSATHAQIGAALAGAVSDEDNNDYAFVQVPTSDATPTQIAKTERYKFNGTAWEYEYDLNNSGYTDDQWAAINSGITAALVSKLSALPTNTELTTALGLLTDGIASINGKIPSAASSSNKMVDNAAMVAYIGQIIDAIDATFNVASADGHVAVQITQVNGVITSVAVTTSDIASASALTLVTGRVTDAEANIISLGGRMTTAETDIDDLQQLYNNLLQSAPVVIEPTDTWPVAVADRSATVIYRVVDRVNTPPQYYSDYMFRASDLSGQPVLMAQYNNAIDPRPKKGSQNLVSSGGVFDNMGALDVSELNATENPHTLATYADLSAALAAIPSDYQKGGMSIKFVQTSDNKYVQYLYKVTDAATVAIFTNVANWEKMNLEDEVSQLEQEVDEVIPLSGLFKDITIPLTANGGIDPNLVTFPCAIVAGTDVTFSLTDVGGIIGSNYLSVYKWVNGVRTRWFSIQAGGTITTSVSDYIGKISFYITASSVSSDGNVLMNVSQVGILGTSVENTTTLANRKVERLAWIGASSSGHIWAVGEKIFNTTKKKLAVCTAPSPNLNFGPDYDASTESLYNYEGKLYQWNGSNLVIISIEDVDQGNLLISGELSKTYSVLGGVGIGGVSATSEYAFPLKIGKGCDFSVLMTTSVVSSLRLYAIKSDGTYESLGNIYALEVKFTAPFDMVAIGVYTAGSNVSADGTYTLTVKKTALWQTQKELKTGGALRYQIDALPENRIFKSSDFAIGNMWHGTADTSIKYRVYMTTIHTAQEEMKVFARSGFRFKVEYFIAGEYSSESGFVTRTTIPQNSDFRIVIRRETEDASEIADIDVFVSQVVYPTGFYNEFKGIGFLDYFGKKLPSLSILSQRFRCSEENIVTELMGASDNYMTAGLVVYNGKALCFTDNMSGVSYCCVFDLTTKTQIAKSTLPWVAHNNNAQPTPYFYDPGDTYPLFLVSYGNYSGGEQKFVFVRVVESAGTFTFTIVKEVSYSGFIGEQYNASWFANYEKGELYCYTYPNGRWSVTADNPIVIYKFAFPSLANYNPVTLTGADIKETITLQDHWIMQSGLYHNGKIFLETQADGSWSDITINGEPYDASEGRHFLFIIDSVSGYIETIVPLHGDQEQEGMCIYDGALYVSEKHTTASVGNVCFRLVKYTFD